MANTIQYVNITGGGAGSSASTVVPATDGIAGIQAAVNAMDSAQVGGIVQLEGGVYNGTARLTVPASINGIIIQGAGKETILAFDASSFNGDCIRFQANQDSSRTDRPAGNTSAAGTSVTTTTHSDAANFLAGDIIHIAGTDADSQLDNEVNEILTSGNGTTGVIALKYPLQKALTSVTIFANRNGKDHELRDLQIRMSGTPSPDCFAVFGIGTTRCKLINVLTRGFNSAPSNPGVGNLYFDAHGWNNLIENCSVEASQNSGIKISMNIDSRVINNTLNYNAISANGSDASIKIASQSNGTIVDGNVILSGESYGIHVEATSGTPCRRSIISNNKVSRSKDRGIYVPNVNLENRIENNTVEFCVGTYSIDYSGSRGCIIGNQIHRGARGINVQGGTKISISGNNIVATTAEAMVIQASAAKVSVSGNTITDCATYGIYTNATKIHLIGNIIDNITGAGLYLDSACVDIVMSGNSSLGNSGNSLTADNAVTNILISGNNFRGGTVSLGTSASLFYNNNME